jgi:hypothetical protein
MGDGFIVRRGGKAEEVLRTAIPSINFVSKNFNEIVVSFTNNEQAEVELYYDMTTTPPTTKITLASGATSSNVTFTELADDTTFTIFAYSLLVDPTGLAKTVKSQIVSTDITTDVLPNFTAATGGTTLEYDLDNKRYRSHTFTSSGTFEVTAVGDNIDDLNKVDYVIIGGPGSGGGFNGGGGGGGGYVTSLTPTPGNQTPSPKFTVSQQEYDVIVAGTGGNSVLFGLTAFKGGNGGSMNNNGQSGGSGGGAGESNEISPNSGGAGFAGPPRQGFNGGGSPAIQFPGMGGGGGAGGGGGSGSGGFVPGSGGPGLVSTIRTGSNETRGGGGTRSGGNVGTGSGSFVCIRYEIAPV